MEIKLKEGAVKGKKTWTLLPYITCLSDELLMCFSFLSVFHLAGKIAVPVELNKKETLNKNVHQMCHIVWSVGCDAVFWYHSDRNNAFLILPLMLSAITRQGCVTSHPKTRAAGHQIQCCPHCTERSVMKVCILSFLFSSAMDLQVWATMCSELGPRDASRTTTIQTTLSTTYVWRLHLKSYSLISARSPFQPHFRQHASTSRTTL